LGCACHRTRRSQRCVLYARSKHGDARCSATPALPLLFLLRTTEHAASAHRLCDRCTPQLLRRHLVVGRTNMATGATSSPAGTRLSARRVDLRWVWLRVAQALVCVVLHQAARFFRAPSRPNPERTRNPTTVMEAGVHRAHWRTSFILGLRRQWLPVGFIIGAISEDHDRSILRLACRVRFALISSLASTLDDCNQIRLRRCERVTAPSSQCRAIVELTPFVDVW
jgi:hypothetical protein